MSSATALAWFARHELRLAWREWLAVMTAGRRGRKRAALVGLVAFAAIMHLPAYAVIGRFANLQLPPDISSLIIITAVMFLAWALMLSQAIESVTRVFYARADLDLIMSSPARLTDVFSIRIAAIALSVTAMSLLFSTPFIDVLVIGGGFRWLAAYGVIVTIGLSSWMTTARVVRGEVLRASALEFVAAARALGASSPRILLRHALPQALPVTIVSASLGVAQAVLTESALSYLGLGVQPPTP